MEDHQSEGQGQIDISMETQSLSVAPGGTLTVPVSLHNQGEGDELLELSVRGIPTAWVSLPSRVVRLSPWERRDIEMTVKTPAPPWIRAGRHSAAIRAERKQGPDHLAELKFSLTVAAQEVPGRISILMETTEFSVIPGESISVPVILLNRGSDGDSLYLTVQGIPEAWATTPSASLRLSPGQQREVRLTIRPPRSTASLAGPQPFKILVRSQFISGQMAEVACILTIAAFAKFSSELQSRRTEAGQPARVLVENQGNMEQIFTLTWASPGDHLSFHPAPFQEVHVRPGEQEIVECLAKPRRRSLLGGDEICPFTASVESAGEPVQTHMGEATTRALLQLWMLAPLIIGALAILAIWFVLGT
jgi:uncharacterized membrane protein